MKALMFTTILLTAVAVSDPGNGMAMDLTQFQWKNRLLLIFAPESSDPRFKKVHSDIITRKPEVDDRDLVVFEVFEQGPSRMNTTNLDPEAVESIRKRFAVPRNSFKVILIGKDGGIKLKQDGRADLDEIFNRIDAMPMRQNEMRQKNQKRGK